MDRRKFFGLTLGALTAAGLPEILLPQRTLFLPPKHGWHPAALADNYMREACQYWINTDQEVWRYDAIGRDIWGREHQFHVDMHRDTAEPHRIELAKRVIGDRFRQDGLAALKIGESREFTLALSDRTQPYGALRYV